MQSTKTVKTKSPAFFSQLISIHSLATLPTIIVMFSLSKYILGFSQVFLENLNLISTDSWIFQVLSDLLKLFQRSLDNGRVLLR